MATLMVSCTCVQSTMVEGTCIMQIQPKGDLLPEAIFTGCKQNVTMAIVLIRSRVVQGLMLIHTTIVK